jgi:hypothetical protein
MKYATSILVFTMLFPATSSFAAKQITHEESAGYTKLGDVSIGQSGTPTVGHKELSMEVDKKCQELGEVKANDCYYIIADTTGNETNHKNVDIEIFKK